MKSDIDKLLGNFDKPRNFKHNCYFCRRSPHSAAFFYVKVHKGASTTIISSLASRMSGLDGNNFPDEYSEKAHSAEIKDLIFENVSKLSIEDLLTAFSRDSDFRFTMLRDPVKRVVSAWADKIDGGGRIAARLKSHLGMPRSQTITLSDFIGLISSDRTVLDFDHHWRPQIKEIGLDTLRYDFIGDTGQLQKSLDHVYARVFGEASASIVDTRASLGHFTNSQELTGALTDKDARILERLYQADRDAYEAAKSSVAALPS